MNSFGIEKAVTFRQPSTANLMIDSADRPNAATSSPFNFQISRTNSILNGFFSRIGTTEVVMEWGEPNIVDEEILIDVSGASVRSTETLSIFTSFLTMAELLDAIVATSPINGVTLSVGQAGANRTIDASGGKFQFLTSPLAVKAALTIGGGLATSKTVGAEGVPDLRLYRYIDFTSPQITYAQDLKDNSTQLINRDVLCRWYMAEDQPESRDVYGFPILMGYEPFFRRRLFNPPKQIKWDNNLPLGNLQFELYDDDGNLLVPVTQLPQTNFLMTLQASEN
jgi:hypothetical protein